MRGYDKAGLCGRLLELLERSDGMTGSAISVELGVSRITMSKYLGEFASEGMIRPRSVGNSTMWHASPGAVRLEFPSDYARAGRMYLDAVSALSEGEAGSVLGSCMGCGATAVDVLSEVLVPAIRAVQKMYDSGKIGSAEESLMHSIISRSAGRLEGADGGVLPPRHAILLAADRQGMLYAQVTASVLSYAGWRVMRLGNMSHAVGVLLDTEIKKLLVRARAPDGGVTAIMAFSSKVDGLRALGAAVDSARRGAASGTLLALCGPADHGAKSDVSVTEAADIVHWADSLG